MRLYRNAVILSLVLILLVTAFMVLKNKNKDETDADGNNVVSNRTFILELDKDKVSEISVERPDGKYIFNKVDNNWSITYPEGLQFDKNRIEGIELNLIELDAFRTIEENAKDLSKYGLDNPIIISVKLTDGKVEVVELGRRTPTKEGYYIKHKDNNNVYTVRDHVGEMLMLNLKDIRNKYFFDLETNDIIRYSLGRNGQKVFDAKKLESGKWSLTWPVSSEANMSKLNPMLEPLASVRIEEFLGSSAEDRAQYGLDVPRYYIETATVEKSIKILIGKEKTRNSEVYAMIDGTDEIFTMRVDQLGFLDTPLRELVNPFIYMTHINDVSKIVVEMDGKTVISEVYPDTSEEKDKDKDRFVVDGKDATMKDENGDQPFRLYYQALIGLILTDVEPDAKPEGAAEITMTYYLRKDPGIVKMSFISKDDHNYYVMRDDAYTGLIISKKTFDKTEGVRDSYQKLLKAINSK